MTGSAATTTALTTLDYLLSVMDTPKSRVDFAIIFHFTEQLDLDALCRGAESARNMFPTSGSRLKRNRWVRDIERSTGSIATDICSNSSSAIERFVNRPLDPEKEFPVQQLVVTSSIEPKTTLVTRFHHAVADGMSAALWLSHQLEVARRLREPYRQTRACDSPVLRFAAESVRKSQFAYLHPSDRLATSTDSRSGSRSWLTIDIDALELRKLIRSVGRFTYSDLLATCAMEVYSSWNRSHDDQHLQQIGLWLPINVRSRSMEGFGNGTSRIRIYARYPPEASLADKCREVRRQIEWCMSHGEWAIPEIKGLTLLPRSLMGPILRRKLTRRSLDMATGVFSHADRWNSTTDGVFNNLAQIECVGLLHPFHSVAINGATHNGRTHLTFTYDTGLLTRADVARLTVLFQKQIDLDREQFR